MKTYNQLVQENGFLTDDGEKFIELFKLAMEGILSSDEVNHMSIAELRVLGSVLSAKVADAISKKMINKNDVITKFKSMTDQQFEQYLQDKYGDGWQLVPLTPEEEKRVPRLTDEEIRAALEEGRKRLEDLNRSGHKLLPFPIHRYKGKNR